MAKKLTEKQAEKFLKNETKLAEQMVVDHNAEEGGNPYIYGAGLETGCLVVCPDCGQQIPSGYESFISQEAADAYAREHCDCQMLELLPFPLKSDPPAPTPPLFGSCRFCGQAQSVSGCNDEPAAEECATRHCKCSQALAYQDKLAYLARRASDIAEANANINDLFGAGTSDLGDETIGEEVLELLKSAVELVYDHKLVSQQLNLTYTIKAKIGRSGKGNLTIERKDTTSSKLEV